MLSLGGTPTAAQIGIARPGLAVGQLVSCLNPFEQITCTPVPIHWLPPCAVEPNIRLSKHFAYPHYAPMPCALKAELAKTADRASRTPPHIKAADRAARPLPHHHHPSAVLPPSSQNLL